MSTTESPVTRDRTRLMEARAEWFQHLATCPGCSPTASMDRQDGVANEPVGDDS